MRKRRFIWVTLMVITVLFAVACAPRPTPAPPTPVSVAPTLVPATPTKVPAAPTPTQSPATPTKSPTTPAPTPAVKLPPAMSVATAGVGTTGYIAGSAIAEVIGKYTGTKLTVEPAGATARWVPLMKTKDIEFAIGCAPADVKDAYYGTHLWKDKGPQPVLYVATANIEPYGFFVTDPNIKSIADLKGKKIYGRMVGQRITTEPVPILLQAAGLKPGDVELLNWSDINEAVKGVQEGKAVGIFQSPSPLAVLELDRTKPVYGVPIPKEMADKVIAEFPELGFITWKKGVGVGKEDIPYLGLPCGLYARADLEPDVVYTFMSTIYSHYDEYKDKHPVMKLWTPEQGPTIIPLPMHPGVIKYYKEKGLWTEEKEKLQQKLLALPRG